MSEQLPLGGEPYQPDTYCTRICILSDVRCMEVFQGVIHLHKVFPDGVNVPDPIDTAPAMNGEDYRKYICANCGWECDGAEEFETMRAHIGKRNLFIHPFAESIYPLNTP